LSKKTRERLYKFLYKGWIIKLMNRGEGRRKMKSQRSHWTIIMMVVVILASSIATDIFLKKQYESKIATIQQDYQGRIEEQEGRITALNTLLQNAEEQNQREVKKLSSLIRQAQEESQTKLSSLEEELKGISIEAGDFSAVVQDALKGVVSIITDKGQGSGTIMTSDGYVMTNYHVIEGAKQLSIVSYNKKVYAGSLVGTEKVNDLAVLKISSNDTFRELKFTNSESVKIGEKVVALGNPAGLGFTATQGIISQKDRRIAGTIGLLQTDVPINPGSSGGPLINSAGKVVGILRSKIAGYESLGFAIPSNYVVSVAQEITGKNI